MTFQVMDDLKESYKENRDAVIKARDKLKEKLRDSIYDA